MQSTMLFCHSNNFTSKEERGAQSNTRLPLNFDYDAYNKLLLDKKIVWERSLEVGNKKIDFQHGQLFYLYNDLICALQNPEKFYFIKVLKKIKINATKHFITEEKELKDYGFDDLGNHCNEHDNFLIKIDQIIENFNSVDSLDPQEVYKLIEFLGEWIEIHVKKEVPLLKRYFKNSH